MALLNLSAVTRVLVRLMQEGVSVSPAWDGSVPNVSPLPPDKLGDAGDLLGFYLYHLSEDPHFRNAPPPSGSGPVPVALAPMGVVLHYQLTAHTTASPDAPDGAYKAQLLFGLAIKVLHDNPSLSDATVINGVALLASVGLDERENRFRLTLRPVAVEDAVSYWMAGQGPARLAAYYQVSVVMLEPETPSTGPPRVIEPRVGVFAGGPPHLTGSRNPLTFVVPDAGQRTVTVSPAQVPIGGRFALQGTDLAGDATELLLEAAGWPSAEVVDPAAWAVVITPGELTATVGTTAGAKTVVPGVYSAAVRRTSGAVPLTSNRTAFLVCPVVSDPGAAAAGDVLVLTGALFAHPSVPVDPDDDRAVQVLVGAARLALDDDGILAAGEYVVTDAETLTVRLPLDLPPGFLPLRVRVNGAECPPRWVEVTA